VGIRDLQTQNRCLHRWNFSCESRFTNRLRIAKTSYTSRNNILTRQLRIHPLQIPESLH
jgi:hypothetical protein